MKTKLQSLLFLTVFLILVKNVNAQTVPDTIIINVGDQGKIIIQVKDASKIDEWKKFDLNKVIANLDQYLERKNVTLKNDTTFLLTESDSEKSQFVMVKVRTAEKDTTNMYPLVESGTHFINFKKKQKQVTVSKGFKNKSETVECEFFLHLGFNNYLISDDLENFRFVNRGLDRLNAIGSRYVAISLMAKSPLNSRKNFNVSYGLELNWYNFVYSIPNRTYGYMNYAGLRKHKLTAYYINVPVIFMYDQGKKGFRIGVGPYIGYRLGAYSKIVGETGEKNRYQTQDDFGLAGWRAGLRLQVGVRKLNFFFNYDLTNLYDRTPFFNKDQYNAFSFGIIL